MTAPLPNKSLRDEASQLWIPSWLGSPRLAKYLDESDGGFQFAMVLYEWHAQVSAAFLHDLAHFEVCLRNAYDICLTQHLQVADHWSFKGDDLFSVRRAPDAMTRAAASLAKSQRVLARATLHARTPDDIISRLPFGFWRALTSSSHEIAIWRPALHRAYPPGTRRAEVSDSVSRLHRLRNRCAHHKSLLHLDLYALHLDLLTLAGTLQPKVAEHIARHTQVPALLAQRPSLRLPPQPPR